MNFLAFCVFVIITVATFLAAPASAERSPIFGGATIEAISPEAARDITARGAWADHYGGQAVSFAYQAYIFAYYARFFAGANSSNEQAWYGAAAWYSYHAFLFATWAQSYSQLGM